RTPPKRCTAGASTLPAAATEARRQPPPPQIASERAVARSVFAAARYTPRVLKRSRCPPVQPSPPLERRRRAERHRHHALHVQHQHLVASHVRRATKGDHHG